MNNKSKLVLIAKSVGRVILAIVIITVFLICLKFVAGQIVDALSWLQNFLKHPTF